MYCNFSFTKNRVIDGWTYIWKINCEYTPTKEIRLSYLGSEHGLYENPLFPSDEISGETF